VALDVATAGAAVCRDPGGLAVGLELKELLDGRVVSHDGERFRMNHGGRIGAWTPCLEAKKARWTVV
jgi:hypothetical protein